MERKAAASLIALAVLAAPLAARPVREETFPVQVLNGHNLERQRLAISPLTWSDPLAAQAQVWADSLAARDTLAHDPNRGGVGESLWAGAAGRFKPEQMIGTFLSEKPNFRPGRFPDVSITGKWNDVGHYSQIIWPASRELGCGLARGRLYDVLVCRYTPAGNIIGQQVP